MDAQTLQFALFLGIAAALYTLVTVGLEIARRFSLQSRATGIGSPSATSRTTATTDPFNARRTACG
jgi:hypothetical protein